MGWSDVLRRRRAPKERGDDTLNVVGRAEAMAAHLGGADTLFRPSEFWRDLSAQNVAMIRANGIGNFKRTISQNYFNWVIDQDEHPQMQALRRLIPHIPGGERRQAKIIGDAKLTSINDTEFLQSPQAAESYAHFVEMLWRHANRGDGPIPRLAEPEVGNPVRIEWRGALISQDLANSVREYRRFFRRLEPRSGEPKPVLAEIGAGYGRLGYVALSAQPCRYWIFDIPPALAVAEWYLAQLRGERRVFRWRPFEKWAEVEADVEAADVAIFTIDQLPLIPDRSVRCFAAVSALHEFRPEQIEAFMALMGEKASGGIYTKNHTEWLNERDAFTFRSTSLQAPKGWHAAFDRPDDVIDSFTEKLFLPD